MSPSDVLVQHVWEGLEETAQPDVLLTIAEVIHRDKQDLAGVFYSHMMTHSVAASYLSPKTVQEHLKPGLERWMEVLLCQNSLQELEVALAMQHHVGEIHARAEIPINLVAMGFRLIKREINIRLLASSLKRESMVNAILRVDALMDIALEEMSNAYVHSHEKGVRNEEAFRLFSAGHNLSAERERQLGAILEWENRLFRSMTIGSSLGDVAELQSSSFGLWFRHKAPLLFDETRELPLIEECMSRVDLSLLPQITSNAIHDHLSSEFRNIIRIIIHETEQMKFLLSGMFDRLTDMEVGRDPLTQLFNRRFLPTILKRETELSRRKSTTFALLMMDVDFFKKVNDTHGHESGDRVLQQVAALAMNRIRAGDFIFRYGGEEFLVVLTEVDSKQAQDVAEKIRQRIASVDILLAGEQTVKVTVSIGIALSDGHPDYQRQLEKADKALYEAKHSGRNRCIFS